MMASMLSNKNQARIARHLRPVARIAEATTLPAYLQLSITLAERYARERNIPAGNTEATLKSE
jgi:hypothetical protein